MLPPYLRDHHEPFSRAAAVAIAYREWRSFGQLVVDNADSVDAAKKPEREDGMWQRVGDYWWLGAYSFTPYRGWTGKHDETGTIFPADQDGIYAWSAAFIDYVMRMSGARDLFPYGVSHAVYINAAVVAARNATPHSAVVGKRVEEYAPNLGDLICTGRHEAATVTFDALPIANFPSHCAIVVRLGERDTNASVISVIGGNVADAVALTHVPVTSDGKLANSDGHVIDERYPWFIVIAVQYEI